MSSRVAILMAALLPLLLTGCRAGQSVFAPHGPEAARLATLAWVLIAGGAVILTIVLVITIAAFGGSTRVRAILSREATVICGGLIFPLVTLSMLLTYGIGVTRAGIADDDHREPLRIAIVGERWWWRVRYALPNGGKLDAANELRIPVGRPVELTLSTADVIHSFWVPNLAGKVDMIPGRTTRLRFTATKEGVSRGQCAEYCGGAHALMAFNVVALHPAKYDSWIAREAEDAKAPASDQESRGLRTFVANGCGGCHTIRGTRAIGRIGPDLTHVGSRLSLAAATLPNSLRHMSKWIRDNQKIKPENLMLPYGALADSNLAAVSAYLTSLK